MSGPAYHGRTHCPGGTDPIPCNLMSSGGVFTTYRECTLARETLLYFWPLDDAAGSATVRELVSGNSGTVFTASSFPVLGVAGPFVGLPDETAAEFSNAGVAYPPGNAARIEVSLSATDVDNTFDQNHAWAVEMHVFTATQNHPLGTGTLFHASTDGTTNTGAAQLALINSGGAVIVRGTRRNTSVDSAVLPLGTWYHVRLTYDGTTLRLYIDGTLVASAASAGSINVAGITCRVGNNGNLTGSGYVAATGRIANVAIYSSAASTFCATEGEGGGSDAIQHTGAWADGAGGLTWHLVQADNIEDAAVTSDALAPASVIAGKIAAGTIVNADVSATADVAVTKLAEGADRDFLLTVGTTPTWTDFDAAVAALVEDAGRWELVMEDGVTNPPVPVETEAQDDWVYAWVAG